MTANRSSDDDSTDQFAGLDYGDMLRLRKQGHDIKDHYERVWPPADHEPGLGASPANPDDAPQANRREALVQLEKLAEGFEATRITPRQFELLAKHVASLQHEIDDRFGRYRELLVEHTPEHLELNEDATAAHILGAKYKSQLRRVDGGWRAWDGKKWAVGGTADEIARGFVREIGETFSAFARDISVMIATIGRYIRLTKLLRSYATHDGLHDLANVCDGDAHCWSTIYDAYADDGRHAAVRKLSDRLTSARGVNAALALAETLRHLKAKASDFDTRRDMLNAANGVIDLRSGALLPHDPAYMLTQICPYDYDPNAQAPRWEQFLEEVHPDPDVRAYVSRRWGYCITGEMCEQEFTVLLGPGGDGKSIELDTVGHVLGPDFAKVATHGLLVDDPRGRSKDAQNATVEGARLVMLPEWPKDARIDLAHIKHVTGGTSEVTANRMRENTYRYAPTYKLVISANRLPDVEIADATSALWSRARLLRYSRTFRGTDREDKQLIERLRAEACGILAWAVREAGAYYADGLRVPSEVRAWVAEWRNNVNHIAAWIDERCDVGQYMRSDGEGLYSDYRTWARVAGYERQMSSSQFYGALSELGYASKQSNGKRYRDGLQLRGAFVNAN